MNFLGFGCFLAFLGYLLLVVSVDSKFRIVKSESEYGEITIVEDSFLTSKVTVTGAYNDTFDMVTHCKHFEGDGKKSVASFLDLAGATTLEMAAWDQVFFVVEVTQEGDYEFGSAFKEMVGKLKRCEAKRRPVEA